MKKVLIGVGGSGQHVVHAYLRLLALSNVTASEVPNVYLIDADAKKDTSVLNDSPLARDINYLHGLLVSPLVKEARPDFELVRPYLEKVRDESPGTASKALGVDSYNQLADALLMDDSDPALNDYKVQVGEGMMANARVGASVFGLKLEQAKGELLSINFSKLVEKVAKANVAIVGSTFGGTGSGVIPALVRFLDNCDAAYAPESVRAFMTLPWFDIDSSNASDKSAAREHAGINPMTRNASLGLRTYINELESSLTRSNYVISQFLSQNNIPRKDNGNFNQSENPHVFNLILATSIQHFLHGDGVKTQFEASSKRKLFGLIATGEEAHGVFDALSSAHLRFRVAKDDNRCLQDMVLDAEVMALALEKGAEYIKPGADQFSVKGGGKYVEPQGLRELLCKVASLERVTLIKRGGMLGMGAKEVAPDEVYKKLTDSLLKVAQIARQSLLWLDNHKKTDDHPTGVKISAAIQHLFEGRLVAKGGHRELEMQAASEQMLDSRWGAYQLKIANKQAGGTVLPERTPKISQAFTLFTNIFCKSEFSFLDELNKQMDSQRGASVYDLAAQIMAGQVYEEVIAARNESRQKEYKNDIQDSQILSASKILMLKGLDQSEQTPETSRLCRVSAEKLDPKNALKDEHPLSLRRIDPYLGVKSISQLLTQKGAKEPELVFPETALKGIPNILAPMLLQQWRLACFEHGKQPALVANSPGESPRSTPYGIYLHGRRIVEAGFWLLFTRDRRVKLIETNTDGIDQLVKNELRRKGQEAPRYMIQLNEGEYKGQAILVNDPQTGWYLAANVAARKFLASIMPELPSVKYGDSQLDAMWRGKIQAEKTRPDKDSYDANLIQVFAEYLRRTIQQSDVNQSNLPLWHHALKDLTDELESKVNGLIDSAKGRSEFDVVGNIILSNSTGVSSYVVETPRQIQYLQGLFIPKPVYFHTRDPLSKELQWQRVWPLKGEAWQYVDLPQNEANAVKVRLLRSGNDASCSRSVWHWDELRLKVNGLGEKVFVNPFTIANPDGIPGLFDETEEFAWSSGVWPSFRADDWSYYIAGGDFHAARELSDFDLKGNPLNGEKFELVFYGETQKEGKKVFAELGRVKNTVPIKLHGVPRSVELVLDGQVLGSIPIQLTQENKARASCSIALDFGTSNTCMALKRNDKTIISLPLLAGEPLADDGTPLPDFTWSAGNLKTGGAANRKYRHQILPTLFFQSFNQKAIKGSGKVEVRSIPSELLFVSGLHGKATAKAYVSRTDLKKYTDFGAKESLVLEDHSGVPIVSPLWTPFPPNVDDTARQNIINDSNDGTYVEGFKWPSELHGNLQQSFRAVYLENILVSCFATLRQMGFAKTDDIIATYPGAFHDDLRKVYAADLTEIISYLSDQCGVIVDKQKISLRSETIAALSSCHRGDEDISLTIDMGGGTTDIGLIIPGMQKTASDDIQSEDTPVSYMASLRYAGNDLLKAIIQANQTGTELSRLLQMKVDIRQSKSGEIKFQNERACVTKAFFDGLFEYVFTLLAAFGRESGFPQAGQIDVYLFGNGFKLVPVFLGKEMIDVFNETVQEAVACKLLPRDIAKRIVIKGIGDGKLTLVQGAFSEEHGSPVGRQHQKVEQAGHGRVPIWLPCIMQNRGESKANSHAVRETFQEREDNENDDKASTLKLIKGDDALKSSFPLTYKYWKGSETVNALFNKTPNYQYPFLGKFYLEGRENTESSFVKAVLYRLAQESENPFSREKRYDT